MGSLLPAGFFAMRTSLNGMVSLTEMVDHNSPVVAVALITLKNSIEFYKRVSIAQGALTVCMIRFFSREDMPLPIVALGFTAMTYLSRRSVIMWNRSQTLARAYSSINQFQNTGVRPEGMNDNILSALASLPTI